MKKMNGHEGVLPSLTASQVILTLAVSSQMIKCGESSGTAFGAESGVDPFIDGQGV